MEIDRDRLLNVNSVCLFYVYTLFFFELNELNRLLKKKITVLSHLPVFKVQVIEF